MIHDVAKRLNLSITTVSRALNGHDDVAARTRQRVIRVAREMGYVPSRAARQLRCRQTDVIGYILPTRGAQFTDPFFSEFIAGLGDEATSHNFDLLISTAAPDTDAERQIYERWTRGRFVDGIVLSRMRLQDWRVKYLVENNLPVVAHGHTVMDVRFPYIEMDSRYGFAALIKHLVERGYRRIAYIGAPPGITLQVERFAGYRDGLARAGIPFDERLVAEGDLTRSGGYRAARRLLDLQEPPTAIIGANDLMAIGAIRMAHERGLKIGDELAIAGYDGTEDSEHTQPPLTTLKQPIYETARRLVSMLLVRITGGILKEEQVILRPELVIRGSTGG